LLLSGYVWRLDLLRPASETILFVLIFPSSTDIKITTICNLSPCSLVDR
jgi:hypothetical protein